MIPIIKRLSEEDIEIAKSGIEKFLDKDEMITENNKLIELLKKESFYYIAAILNNEVIGRLLAYEFDMYKDNTKEVYLYEIDVLKEYQQQGIATKLILFTKDICREREVSYMFVGTEPDNIPAQKLYIKTGGRPEGNLPHYEYKF